MRFQYTPTPLTRRSLALALALGVAPLACDNGPAPSAQEAETSDALRWTGGNEIRIARSVLGQEWLLQGSVVEQRVANYSTGLQSKIVRFEQHDQTLLMLDAGDGQSIGEYHSALAKFPIIFEGNRTIGIDFDAGMRSSFIYSSDWHSSQSPFGADTTPFELKESYVVDGRQNGNRFVIRQSAQIDIADFFGEVRDPHIIEYYLEPYSQNRNYQPMLSPGHDVVSFFENTPRFLPNLKQQYQVTRFDASRPIRFAISHDVPTELRAAIREGILYWNTVMGRTFVEVVNAPAGRHAPDPDLNIIEWINEDDAGFAYADAQVDPRTGEVLHAQVFLTSGWAVYSREQAFRLAVQNESVAAARVAEKGPRAAKQRRAKVASLGVLGMGPSELEARDDDRAFTNALRGLERMARMGATNAQILEGTRDILRVVTAHEVGHTLGLRHNFAGSIASNYSQADAAQVMQDYLDHGAQTPASIIPSSTVMDYAFVNDDLLIGDLIGRGVALSYDVVAMHALYDGVTADLASTPAVCNDEAFGFGLNVNFTDCQAFDVGGSVLDNAIQSRDDLLGRAVSSVLIKGIAYKTDLLDPKPVAQVIFDPSFYGALAPYGGLTSHLGFAELLSYFYGREDAWEMGIISTSLAQARNASSYPNFGALEDEELIAQRSTAFEADLAAHDPLADVMAPLDQVWIDAHQAELDAVLASASLTSGTAPNGQAYVLSADEIELLRSKGRAFLAAIPVSYFSSLVSLTAFFATEPLDGPGLEVLGSVRARIVHDGVFNTTHQVLTATVTLTSSTTEVTSVVSVPVPLYDQVDRLMAVDLLGGSTPRTGWMTDAALTLQTEIEDYAAAQFGVTYQELADQVSAVPHPLRRWVEDLIALHDGVAGYSGL